MVLAGVLLLREATRFAHEVRAGRARVLLAPGERPLEGVFELGSDAEPDVQARHAGAPKPDVSPGWGFD